MAVTLKYRFAMRRWDTAGWAANDEVILSSEWAYDTTTGQLKIGNGVTLYSLLPFFSTSNIPEGSRLYFTNSRVAAALAQGTGITLTTDPTTGVTTIASSGGGGTADLATIWASS